MSSLPSDTPFDRILAWSKQLLDWQADALRRIITQGDLRESDLDDLEALCRASHGLAANEPAAAPVRLSDEHIPVGPDASSSVSLVALEQLRNVNQIKDGSTIEFGSAPGLTVAFGANGSGKSGYGRVIKRAGRTRGSSPNIRSNVFDPASKPPASAQIRALFGKMESVIPWRDGAPTDPRLSNIFVFDTASARLHVAEDGPTVFIPRGLDVLPKLARAFDELKARLKMESDALETKAAQVMGGWKCRTSTRVGKLVASLSAATDGSVVLSLAAFDAQAARRLTEIKDALRADPLQKADLTAATARRLRRLSQLLAERSDLLEVDQVARLRQAHRAAETAKAPTILWHAPR